VTDRAALAEVSGNRTTRLRTRTDAEGVPKESSWRRWAACRVTPLAVFFPVGNSQVTRINEQEAKALCFTCPVRTHCLAFAIEHEEAYGVWGGLNADERRALATPPATTMTRVSP
jgi:WhiB family redox-sensing transcriptional regulator